MIDVADVKARIRLVDLIGRDVTLRRHGGEHLGLCPFHKERTPSFTVNETKGFFHCFGCNAHGDAVGWMEQRYGLDFKDAVAELATMAGLTDGGGEINHRRRPLPAVARQTDAGAARERADKVAWARGLWASAGPIAGTLGETYLRARGITLAVPPTLRFHPALRHADTGLDLPAMVGAVQNGEGRIAGVHRTFLRLDGRAKAAVRSAKKMAGVCGGGAVRLAAAALALAVAEGIETALSVMQATGMAVWAALSLGNMGAVVLPPMVRTVVLCADADAKDVEAGERLLARAAQSHAAHGRRVRIARATDGQDFNDMLRMAS